MRPCICSKEEDAGKYVRKALVECQPLGLLNCEVRRTEVIVREGSMERCNTAMCFQGSTGKKAEDTRWFSIRDKLALNKSRHTHSGTMSPFCLLV